MKLYFHQDGFSLIEVTIVIFIILLMTSAAVPWMKTFAETTKLRSASRSIRDLLEFARSSSITERSEYAVLFDVDNGQYMLIPQSILDESTNKNITNLSMSSISQGVANLVAEESENKNNDTEGLAGRTKGILGVPNTLPQGIEIIGLRSIRSTSGKSNMDYVTFYPDSTAEDFEIYLQGSSGKMFVINVSESTARAGVRQLSDDEIQQMGIQSSKMSS